MDDASPSKKARIRAWLTLVHAPGIGPKTCLRLLDRFGDPERICAAAERELQPFGLKPELTKQLRAPDDEPIARDLEWLSCPRNKLLTLHDDDYPKLLREIADPPPLLFVHGDAAVLSRPQLAIVGSRNPTAGGLQNARAFSRHLSDAGLHITSGLAEGIDGAAHEGALETGGSIAVMGTGLDRVYPARHRPLARRIAETGALVSEFPPGTPVRPQHFPRRNRLISGLSLGTLVVEAALHSGSLITARQAADQGREVFAIPGSIHNPLARGCHSLIRQGAKLVETAQDVIEELSLSPFSFGAPREQERISACESAELDVDYRQLLDEMGFDPVSTDTLIGRTGFTARAVSSMLLLLELEGYVSSAPGGLYCRTSKSI